MRQAAFVAKEGVGGAGRNDRGTAYLRVEALGVDEDKRGEVVVLAAAHLEELATSLGLRAAAHGS